MDQGARDYRRYLSGDDEAVAALVDAYYDSLALYLNTFVRDLSLAEELAEDTFVRLVTKKPRFLGNSSFKTWLYAIGRNLTLDSLRRQNGHPTAPLDAVQEAADNADIEQTYLQQEQRILVHRAMQTLKPDYRQAIWLTYFEEMSAKEVAAVMHRTQKSVEHLIDRARHALKAELKKEGLS